MSTSSVGRRTSYDDDYFEKQEDHIREKMEYMTLLSEEINLLRLNREDAMNGYKELKKQQNSQIESYKKKIPKQIERALPWYETRIDYRRTIDQIQQAATHYNIACSDLSAAKEMLELTEKSADEPKQIEGSLAEVLNVATEKVTIAKKKKLEAEVLHVEQLQKLETTKQALDKQEKEYKASYFYSGAIRKSAKYYEMLAEYNDRVESKDALIKHLDKKISLKKLEYDQCLSHLNEISESIHAMRKQDRATLAETADEEDLGERGEAVGCENPDPPVEITSPPSANGEDKMRLIAEKLDDQLLRHQKSFHEEDWMMEEQERAIRRRAEAKEKMSQSVVLNPMDLMKNMCVVEEDDLRHGSERQISRKDLILQQSQLPVARSVTDLRSPPAVRDEIESFNSLDLSQHDQGDGNSHTTTLN